MVRPTTVHFDKDDVLRNFAVGLSDRITELESQVQWLPRGPRGSALVELQNCQAGWLRYDLPVLANRRFLTQYERKKFRATLREMRSEGLLEIDDASGQASAVAMTVKGLDRLNELIEAK